MSVPESSSEDKFQEIFQIFESSDRDLGEDLWLIAERIMLYRLTRAGEQKRIELASMVHLIHEIMSETEAAEKLSPEIVHLIIQLRTDSKAIQRRTFLWSSRLWSTKRKK